MSEKVLEFVKGLCLVGFVLSFICLIFGGILYGFKVLAGEIGIKQIQKEFLFPLGAVFIVLFVIFYIIKKISDRPE